MKVLVIEDNRTVARHLKHVLARSAVVDIARSAAEAMGLACTVTYDVILLDLGLPDVPGIQVCCQLRADGIASPIIVITGYDEMNLRIALLNAGADDYITKPFMAMSCLRALRLYCVVIQSTTKTLCNCVPKI